jgi:hypothetical protein
MKKLKLDLDEISVETFSTTELAEKRGTLVAHETHIDEMCSANCTGLGVECYTADPQVYACTGGDNCTGAAACTYTGCTVDNVTCARCG